ERLHLHGEAGDFTLDGERPMPVAAGVRFEEHLGRGIQLVHACGKLAHGPEECKHYNATSLDLVRREIVHYSASDHGWTSRHVAQLDRRRGAAPARGARAFAAGV